MKRGLAALLIVLVTAAAYIMVYTKPWVIKVFVVCPDDASDILNRLKTGFEEGNWFTGVEFKTYASGESVREVLGRGVDVAVLDDTYIAEELRRYGYLDWFVEFASRNGRTYSMAVVRGSTHPREALEFVGFILRRPDIYAGLCTVITPRGFGTIPEELQPYIIKYKVVTDMVNRSVVIPENVKRVVSLVPVVTISIIMLGGGDLLVGVDRISPTSEFLQIVYPRIKEVPVAGFLSEFDEEFILSLSPDVVLIRDALDVKRFEKIEIPAVVLPMADFTYEGFYDSIRLLGNVIGRVDEAEELISYCKGIVENMLKVTFEIPRGERPRVYIAMDDGLTTHVSRISKEIIWVAGGLCVAENITAPAGPPRVKVSMETIIEWNPDVIIAWNPKVEKSILADPRWSTINAVKNGRIYVLPRGVREWVIPEAESILGAKWLASKLYPDTFSLSRDEIREFYSRFLNYTVSEEEIDKILSGTYVTTIPGA